MTNKVIFEVCAEFGVTATDIKSGDRHPPVSQARQMICYFLRHVNPRAVARIIKKDRTTVVAAIRNMRSAITFNRDVERIHDRILQRINGNEMTIKLTQPRQEELLNLMERALSAYSPTNPAEKLLFRMVSKVKIRLAARLARFQLDNRSGNSFTLNEEEALAFQCWTNQIGAWINPDEYKWGITICNHIVGEIDRQYG